MLFTSLKWNIGRLILNGEGITAKMTKVHVPRGLPCIGAVFVAYATQKPRPL